MKTVILLQYQLKSIKHLGWKISGLDGGGGYVSDSEVKV